METLKQAFLETLEPSNFSVQQIIVSLSLSLAASVMIYILYQAFYKSRNIGAGVDRCFIIIGPAITALFLAIQSSVPLSLGLLGAMSFVRFRTPVKDPAEIGYVLLLIASSVGASTQKALIMIILFLIVLLALCIQWLIQNHFSLKPLVSFIISIDKAAFEEVEPQLNQFLKSRLNSLTMKTMSVMDDRISIHYQHREISASEKVKFTSELTRLAGQGNIEFFAG
ncbi:MAG: DUF4956 domain-containing protein [Sedimentisphaerales bacterium]|nr:DUF4956 domain-containing protein [Sedimentisphaerales bacterium]